jgi:hypothetical protein
MAKGWKAMRPEGLEAKNNSSHQASQHPSIPAFELIFLLRVFVIFEEVSHRQHKANHFEINLRKSNG